MSTSMIDIKRSITFDTEKRKKDGVLITENVPIRCIITFSGDRLILFSGHRIDISKFNVAKQIVKNGCYNKAGKSSSHINAALSSMKSILEEIFQDYSQKNTIPTKEEIKSEYKRRSGKDELALNKKGVLFTVHNEFMSVVGRNNAWTNETIKKHKVIYNIMYAYNPNLTFADLTEQGLLDLLDYCQEQRGIRNTTLAKHLAFIKQFLSWAEQKGYNYNTAYRDFTPKLKGSNFAFKKVIYLTWDELMRVYNLDIPSDKKYLIPARDTFCLCSFTGLRYSDAYNLKWGDISNNKIDIVTQKDVDHITIDLNTYSAAIIEKYKGANLKNDKVLPVPVNQRYNLYLKEIGELAQLNDTITEVWYEGNVRKEETFFKHQLLTTHVARKTFTVNALALGIPAIVVMRWLGHSDLKTMKPYMEIVDSLKKEEMNKFNKR